MTDSNGPAEPIVTTPPTASVGKVGDRIVWVDCEMTGLDLGSDALVEVAAVVTDAELNELDEGVTVVIRSPDAAFAAMPDVVREMHTASGLIEEIPLGTTLEAAQRVVLDYVRSHGRRNRTTSWVCLRRPGARAGRPIG